MRFIIWSSHLGEVHMGKAQIICVALWLRIGLLAGSRVRFCTACYYALLLELWLLYPAREQNPGVPKGYFSSYLARRFWPVSGHFSFWSHGNPQRTPSEICAPGESDVLTPQSTLPVLWQTEGQQRKEFGFDVSKTEVYILAVVGSRASDVTFSKTQRAANGKA